MEPCPANRRGMAAAKGKRVRDLSMQAIEQVAAAEQQAEKIVEDA